MPTDKWCCKCKKWYKTDDSQCPGPDCGEPLSSGEVKTPDVCAKSMASARTLIYKTFGVYPDIAYKDSDERPGYVMGQDPKAGVSWPVGKPITIEVPYSKLTREPANCSSRVPKGQLDSFVTGLVELNGLSSLGFPVFSVCDCNSFHTSGYLWGLYAAKMAKKKKMKTGPIAVINFDQHSDSGGPTQAIPKSDAWGCLLVNSICKMGCGACFVSVFNGVNGASSKVYARGGKGEALPRKIDGTYTEFWNKAKNYFGEDVKYVFVSIDRDCLKGSLTQWGDGYFESFSKLSQAMKDLLEPLSEARMIGFDITGLPEHEQIARDKVTISVEKVWENLDGDLQGLLEYIKPEFELTVKAINSGKTVPAKGRKEAKANNLITWGKVVFFSGSVSYTNDDKSIINEWNYEKFQKWINGKLEKLLGSKGWKYILCQQLPPVYRQAWKQFELYKSSELKNGVDLDGFACSASLSSVGIKRVRTALGLSSEEIPGEVKIADMLGKKGHFKPQEKKEKK